MLTQDPLSASRFFSFDMTVFSCGDISNSIYNYVLTYASHPNQYLYKGKVFVSTFAGESCGDAAWTNLRTMLSAQGVSVSPAVFFRFIESDADFFSLCAAHSTDLLRAWFLLSG